MRSKLTTGERLQPKRVVVTVLLAVLFCLALLFVGEYFGVHWVRQAGGSLVRASL
jgi:hypothetical protein